MPYKLYLEVKQTAASNAIELFQLDFEKFCIRYSYKRNQLTTV